MAINPPSDIVLDVLNAADPTRAQAATQRLAALGAMAKSTPATTADFTQALAASDQSIAKLEGAGDARSRLMNKSLAESQKTAKAKVAFEASVLNNFIGDMLPKDEPGIYGQGAAGDIWRSMLSNQLANQIAKSGALGISRKLFATHLLPHEGHGAGGSSVASGGAPIATQASANDLSLSTRDEYPDNAVLFGQKTTS